MQNTVISTENKNKQKISILRPSQKFSGEKHEKLQKFEASFQSMAKKKPVQNCSAKTFFITNGEKLLQHVHIDLQRDSEEYSYELVHKTLFITSSPIPNSRLQYILFIYRSFPSPIIRPLLNTNSGYTEHIFNVPWGSL